MRAHLPCWASPFVTAAATRLPHSSGLARLAPGPFSAAHLFRGGEEIPGLVQGLVRLPEFSREAQYLPVEQLTDKRGIYAIPARDLPLLRDLMACSAGRKVHSPASPVEKQ
jgi:hypothetical protein